MSEVQRHLSPDGRYCIAVGSYEMRMSHWINSAALLRIEPRELLLDMGDSLWSTDLVEWSADSRRVTVEMRRYPGDGPSITLDLLPDEMLAVPHAPADTQPVSFASFNTFLDDFHHRRRQ